ncbi:universal stress protein A [Paractinoplanes deccanensis]|uniref:Universal stress protein A n=1 Tax=Paractinoplanes deccanensis TaxID=113561 RepID=A0ABQ3YHL3_9ACTN|nr:universal stress protein [Actinoplanes deccanensis]GID79505.1 universal stress protein A [Actinoplanes deccanensis]
MPSIPGLCPAAIVVGVDESRSSLRAAAYAAGLARRQQALLVVVYARSGPNGLLSTVDISGTGAAQVLDAQDRVEAALRRALGSVPDLAVSLVVRTGSPYAVISEVAHEVQAGTVVVGRPECLAHRIAGSVSRQLIRRGRWPVTIVP